MNYPYIDVHTHSAKNIGIEVINIDDFNDQPTYRYCSIGIHPWKIEKCNHLQQIAGFETFLQNHNICAIGEIGLDRSITTNINLQKDVFTHQLDTAEKYHLPTIIHCVKAYSDIVEIIVHKKLSIPLIFHGFGGNTTIMQTLLQYERAFFSYGHRLLINPKIQNSFINTPQNKILFETDTNDISINKIYNFAAEQKGLNLDELKQIIYNNFTQVFCTNGR